MYLASVAHQNLDVCMVNVVTTACMQCATILSIISLIKVNRGISHPGLAGNAILVTVHPTLVALDVRQKSFTVLSSRYCTTISKISANINSDQVTLLSAAIMMLYYACLAAYGDTSDTHTLKYQPPIAYTCGEIGR